MTNCRYELMLPEIRSHHTEELFTLPHMAEMIDWQVRYGIMEERYRPDRPGDDRSRWTNGGGSFAPGSAVAGDSSSDSRARYLYDKMTREERAEVIESRNNTGTIKPFYSGKN